MRPTSYAVSLADFESIAEAATRGCFPRLQQFIAETNPDYIDPIVWLLKACRATPKVLDLRMETFITRENIDTLSGVRLREDFELKISMAGTQFWPGYDFSATMLLKLINLAYISV